MPPRAAGAKWADVVKPPGSPSRGDGGLGVVRGCYSESRGEAELAEGQAALLLLSGVQGVPVDTSKDPF